MKIHTILYTFFSEFYADFESVTFFRFTSIFCEISTVKVWPKSQKCRFLSKIRHGYGLVRYQSIDFDQGYSGPILGRYVRICGGRCLLCGHGAGTKSRPVSFTQGRFKWFWPSQYSHLVYISVVNRLEHFLTFINRLYFGNRLKIIDSYRNRLKLIDFVNTNKNCTVKSVKS